MTARKFYCANGDCPGRAFAERLKGVAAACARRTMRQQAALEAIAFTSVGEVGARLAMWLGVPASPDALLRQIRRAPARPEIQPAVVGVDDWVWKRGHRYGTILVDPERHQVVDLLPDRGSTSFAAWLGGPAGVRVIDRDRGGEYREGARQGAPGAFRSPTDFIC